VKKMAGAEQIKDNSENGKTVNSKAKPKKSFFDMKPFKGKNKNTSETVDEVLYGGNNPA